MDLGFYVIAFTTKAQNIKSNVKSMKSFKSLLWEFIMIFTTLSFSFTTNSITVEFTKFKLSCHYHSYHFVLSSSSRISKLIQPSQVYFLINFFLYASYRYPEILLIYCPYLLDFNPFWLRKPIQMPFPSNH